MLQDSKCKSGGNSENFPLNWLGCRDWCSLSHHHPAELSAELLSSLTAQLPSWVLGSASHTSRAGAAHPQPHRGSPLSSWGMSPTSDGVSDVWLFRSHGLAASVAVLAGSSPAQLPSYSAQTQPWREASLGQSLEIAQAWGRGLLQLRSVFWDLELELSPLLELLLQAEGACRLKPSKVLGVPSSRQEEKGHGWMLDLRKQPEGIQSSIIVDIVQGICREYVEISSSLYIFQTRMKTFCKSPKQRKYCLCWFELCLTVFYSSVVFS